MPLQPGPGPRDFGGGQGRTLTAEQSLDILGLLYEDITKSRLEQLLAWRQEAPPYHPADRLVVPDRGHPLSGIGATTVGSYLFNMCVIHGPDGVLAKEVGFLNVRIRKAELSDYERQVSTALMAGRLRPESVIAYVNRRDWFAFVTARFTTPTMGAHMVVPLKSIAKKKQEEIKRLRSRLDRGDVSAAAELESNLLASARRELTGDPALDVYDSGAGKTFVNNYKKMAVVAGMSRRNDDGRWQFLASALGSGVDPAEYDAFADQAVFASHSRAVGTRDGGYESKKLQGAFQTMVAGPPGTDCGTLGRLDLTLAPGDPGKVAWRWGREAAGGGEDRLLEPGDPALAAGKRLLLRSPLYCRDNKICSRCMGEGLERIGLRAAGLLTNRVGTKMLNASLKAFHDTSLKVADVDLNARITWAVQGGAK